MPSLLVHGGGDPPARPAVLGGVVQYVAEYLLQALRIPLDKGQQVSVAGVVLQGDAVLAEKLLVGENGVLQLRLEVHVLDLEGEAPVLHLGKVQQLLHHGGQAPGLVDDDPDAPAELLGVVGKAVVQNSLPPAVDGGEGGSELVGDGGDKLAFHFLILADFQGHVVDVVHQLPQLVGVLVFDPGAVASGGDALGRLRHHRHRLHHVVDKEEVGKHHQQHAHQGDEENRQDHEHHLLVHGPQGGHQAHDAHHPAVDGQGTGHGQDFLPRLQVPALVGRGGHLVFLEDLKDVVGARVGPRRQPGGGNLDAPAGADELELDAVFILEALGGLDSLLIIAGKAVVHKVFVEGVGQGLGPGFQALLHGAVVVVGNARGEQRHHQHQQGPDGEDGVENPTLPQAPQAEGFPPLLLFHHLFFHTVTAPTCSRSPRPW